MRRAAAEALWRGGISASLYLYARRNTERPTPNFCALGDQRWAMQGFFDRANGGAISASLCSDATSEERMLANAFGSGRFSFERAAVKGGSSSLKTIIIAEGANIRQLPVHNTATPENFRDWRIDR